MLNFHADALCTVVEKLCEAFHRVGIGHTMDKLVDDPHGIGPYICACVVEDRVERQFIQRL